MRTIKFRVYDTEFNKYMHQDDLKLRDYSLGVLSGEVRGKYGEVFEKFIVEEYAGLKDCNDNEVFESDKVKIRITENISHEGVVIFKNSAFGIERLYLGCKRFTPFTGYAPYCSIEVIGNIHKKNK